MEHESVESVVWCNGTNAKRREEDGVVGWSKSWRSAWDLLGNWDGGGRAAGGKGKVQRHFGWSVGAYLVESSSAAPLAPHVK